MKLRTITGERLTVSLKTKTRTCESYSKRAWLVFIGMIALDVRILLSKHARRFVEKLDWLERGWTTVPAGEWSDGLIASHGLLVVRGLMIDGLYVNSRANRVIVNKSNERNRVNAGKGCAGR